MLLRIAIGKYFENFTTKVTINNFESKKKACSQVKWNTTFYYWLEEFMGFQIKDYICKCAVHCILKDSKCKGMPIFFFCSCNFIFLFKYAMIIQNTLYVAMFTIYTINKINRRRNLKLLNEN